MEQRPQDVSLPEPCPVCDSTATTTLGSIGGQPLHRCTKCGHDFLDPLPEEELTNFYGEHYGGHHRDPVFERLVREKLRSHLLPRKPPPGRLLDVGCGNGVFLTAAREAGYDVFGLDLSESAASICRDHGLSADAGDFLTYDFGERLPFDVITLWDVMEHLPHPAQFVERAFNLLCPGGLLVVKSPLVTPSTVLISSYVPPLGRVLLAAPGHIQYFREQTLGHLFRRVGFATVDWLPVRAMRRPRKTRKLRTLVARAVRSSIHRVAGDGNLLAAAAKPG